MRSLKSCFLAVLIALPGVSYAFPETREKANYIGFDVLQWDFGGADESDGAALKIGRDIGNFFAVELHGGYADPVQLNGADLYEVTAFASLFGRFNLHFDFITLYALGGYTVAKFDDYIASAVIDDVETGFAYGGGIMFFFSPNFAANAAYVRYLDNSDFAATSVSAGLTWYFDWPRLRPRY